MTPKVKIFLDFIGQFIGTNADPRLSGNNLEECFEVAGKPRCTGLVP